MKEGKSIFNWLLILTAGVFGYVGLVIAGEGYVDAIYRMVKLFAMDCEYKGDDLNFFLNIARFLAPMATFSVLLSIVSRFFEKMQKTILVRLRNSYTLQGSGKNYDAVKKQFQKEKVPFVDYAETLPPFSRRRIYAVDEESHLRKLLPEDWNENNSIENYFIANTLDEYSIHPSNTFVSPLSKIVARNYWSKFPVLTTNEKIVIIGTSVYAEELLYEGIITNVLGVKTKIQYNILGDFKKFRSLHYKLSKIIEMGSDSFHFTDLAWHENEQLLLNADRIIIAEEEDSLSISIFNQIKKHFPQKCIHLKVLDDQSLAKSINSAPLPEFVFGEREEICTQNYILQNKFDYMGKLTAANYAVNSQNECVTAKEYLETKEFKKEWDLLDSFTRASNLTLADHIGIKLRLVLNGQCPTSAGELVDLYRNRLEVLTPSEKSRLGEIEHIRWCRFHFMNNWDVNPMVDAKKDKASKLHPLLIPYNQLTSEEQQKDFENYEVIAALLEDDEFSSLSYDLIAQMG